MLNPEAVEDTPQVSQESVSEREKINRILSLTLPTVEVLDLVVPQGETADSLTKDRWIVPISEVARIRADTQNWEGVKLGFFPEGFLVKGELTYSPDPEAKKKKLNYSPRLFKGKELVMQERFPRSAGVQQFARVILGESQEPLTRVEMNSTIDWARLSYNLFASETFQHPRWIEVQDGNPVLVFSSQEDLQNFQPYNNVKLPENTQATSFIQSSGKGTEGTPVIACHESCSQEDRHQHIRTLLTFAQALDPKEISPILVSKFTPTLEDYLHMRIRERVLELLIREKKALPTDWFHSDAVSNAIEAAKGELFRKHLRLETQRPFYVDDWPDIRKTYGLNYQDVIGIWFEDEMIEAFLVISEALSDGPAREILLLKLTSIPFFPTGGKRLDS
ncbi:MAG: hypothetical protein AAB875_02955 [Patescibacteria group bacterium]